MISFNRSWLFKTVLMTICNTTPLQDYIPVRCNILMHDLKSQKVEKQN